MSDLFGLALVAFIALGMAVAGVGLLVSVGVLRLAGVVIQE